MDEILQHVLEIEKQAETRVKEAEAEAEEVSRQARRDAAAYEEKALSELNDEARALVRAREEAAYRRREEELDKAEGDLEVYEKALKAHAEKAVDAVVRALAGHL